MRETLQIINQMQADGVIGKYAIGGAVAASIYLEPFTTKDLDIFLKLPVRPGSNLISLTAIYDYLLARGCNPEGQFINIRGWVVDFLPPTTDLELDAIESAQPIEIDGVVASVMTAEHLAAICLQTGRTKDRYRIVSFIEQEAVDLSALGGFVERYGLKEKWLEFEKNDLRRLSNREHKTSKDDRRRYLQRLPLTKKAQIIEDLRDAGKVLAQARSKDL
jgi:hypothetical protein